MQIRQMNEGDLQKVLCLEQEIFSSPWSEKSFRDAMLSEDNCYLVVTCQEKIVGYCGLWCSYDCADLCNLAVSKAMRGQKLGESLLRQGLHMVKDRGVGRVLLEVRSSNVSAIALYHKLGFEEIGVRPRYYTRPEEDGILMEKVLEAG